MVFDYFLLDAIERDLVREGNNNLVKRCDEIWVFGAVSNGVLAEIQIANEQGRRFVTLPSKSHIKSPKPQKTKSIWKQK